MDDMVVGTVLGSCVAVGIFDPVLGFGGLNHFMLPGDFRKEGLIRSPDAKYGMFAMELLINDLLKLGARKSALRAKVFGGGSVLRLTARPSGGAGIPESNIDFAFEYLAMEGIPVLASDVGGMEPRKIFFFARTGKVLLKRIGRALVDSVENADDRYREGLLSHGQEGPSLLFDSNN